jgi:Fe2+ or Zn2+ uptake regulation protein
VEPTETCLLAPHGDLTARLRGSGFVVKHHRLDLYGVCRACRAG